jgi:dTDP-4-dehydrorhamnose 3,5-epimerase
MIFSHTPLKDVYVIATTSFQDHRGFFSRLFCTEELKAVMGHRQIQQINLSKTHRIGAVRGLHLQKAPFAEMKLIRCIRGRVWDVTVDLRKDSSTFLRWFGVELEPGNEKMLIIPEGCAHGFQVLEKDSELLYLHTAHYTPSSESGIHPQDPMISIKWPLEIAELSARDANLPYINDHFTG